jgi:hypothetical protein
MPSHTHTRVKVTNLSTVEVKIIVHGRVVQAGQENVARE